MITVVSEVSEVSEVIDTQIKKSHKFLILKKIKVFMSKESCTDRARSVHGSCTICARK